MRQTALIVLFCVLFAAAQFVVFFGLFFVTVDQLAVAYLSQYWSEQLILETLTRIAPLFGLASLVFAAVLFVSLQILVRRQARRLGARGSG